MLNLKWNQIFLPGHIAREPTQLHAGISVSYFLPDSSTFQLQILDQVQSTHLQTRYYAQDSFIKLILLFLFELVLSFFTLISFRDFFFRIFLIFFALRGLFNFCCYFFNHFYGDQAPYLIFKKYLLFSNILLNLPESLPLRF